MRKVRGDERGAVAILVSLITCFLLFTICALVVDLGFARDQKQASQVASDSAALAGANVLYQTGGTTGCTVSPCFAQAIHAVESYTATNFPSVTNAAWASCTDPGKYYVYSGLLPAGTVNSSCISFANDANAPNSTQPTKVRVRMPTVRVPTFFAGLTGTDSVPVATSARAKLQPGMNRSCGLCLLGTQTSVAGNGDVTVTGASIHTNGSLSTGPNGHYIASPAGQSITAVGNCTGNCQPSATYAPAITDPYATVVTLPPAELSTATVKTNSGNPCGATSGTTGPGIYFNNITLPNSTCALQPGLYIIAGGWSAKNNTMLTGTGVTLYFTCKTGTSLHACVSPGEAGGFLDMTNGNAQLSSMSTGSLKGFVLVYDRNDNSALTMQGNGNTVYTGTIYAAKAQLTFPGNSCVTVNNGPIVANYLYSNGNKACMTLSNAAGANIYVPPTAPNLDQ